METAARNWVPTPSEPSSIRGQIVYDERPGGAKMPLLHADGSVVRQADFIDKPHAMAEKVRAQKHLLSTTNKE